MIGSRRRKGFAALGIVAITATLALVAFTGYWRLQGGRVLIVTSPSMGTVAPVGTLLWTTSTSVEDLHVGDVITFRPPANFGTHIYTHRIIDIRAGGAITTKGDINAAADPWVLHSRDVLGVVAMRWWVMGWLVKGLPILIIGAILLGVLLTRFTHRDWRVPLATCGSAFLIALTIFVLKPLTRAEQVSFVPHATEAQATYVATGILPMRISEAGGRHTDLRPGELGSVVTSTNHAGRFSVHLALWMSPWWWALLALWFIPPLWYLTRGRRIEDPTV